MKLTATAFVFTLLAIATLLFTGRAMAAIQTIPPGSLNSRIITCEEPVRLSRDCSEWQGATRRILIDRYAMSVAANEAGDTLLITGIHPLNSGVGLSPRFPLHRLKHQEIMAAGLQRLLESLQQRNIALQRITPVKNGNRLDGYFVRFQANAYDAATRYTFLQPSLAESALAPH